MKHFKKFCLIGNYYKMMNVKECFIKYIHYNNNLKKSNKNLRKLLQRNLQRKDNKQIHIQRITMTIHNKMLVMMKVIMNNKLKKMKKNLNNKLEMKKC